MAKINGSAVGTSVPRVRTESFLRANETIDMMIPMQMKRRRQKPDSGHQQKESNKQISSFADENGKRY